jgi:hypothetical protein
VKWPFRREPGALPKGEQDALGKRLKRAVDKGADDAGIKPGGFAEDDGQETGNQEK